MLRGFRWQFAALLISGAVFLLVISNRAQPAPLASIPSPTATQTQSVTSVGSDTETNVLPTASPEPIVLVSAPVADSVPTFREALIGRVQRLNPLLSHLNPVDRDISTLIFEGLTQLNAYGEAVPDLARNWIISDDNLEYVISLREDILWQDGTPFTADDVVFTMSMLSSPDFPVEAEIGTFWRTVETQKLGPYTIRFRLSQPLGNFLSRLSIGLLPAHAFGNITAAQLVNHRFNLTPIGTGPYQIEALRGGEGRIDAVDLRVSPIYRQRPEGQQDFAVDRMRFLLYSTFDDARSALVADEVDGLASRSMTERQQLATLGGDIRVYTGIEPTVGVLIYNWEEGEQRFFSDPRIRLALQQGLNRVGPVETRLIQQAIVAQSPIPPSSWAYVADLPWLETNTELARGLISEALSRRNNGAEGEATEEVSANVPGFSILIMDQPSLVELAREIAAQWFALGLNVTVDAVSESVFQERLENGEFEAAIVEQDMGLDPDAYIYWHAGQHPDGMNYGAVSDESINEALERARQDANGINRKGLYTQFQQLFIERAVGIPLYVPLFTYAVNDRISGIQISYLSSEVDRFRNIENWTISDG